MDERWFEILQLGYNNGRLTFIIDKILQDEKMCDMFYRFTGRNLSEVIYARP